MPARHTTITCPAGVWTLLSDGAVSAIRLHRDSNISVQIQATATNAAPNSTIGSIDFGPGTLTADLALSSLFPGVGSGPYYIWALAAVAASISVSHA